MTPLKRTAPPAATGSTVTTIAGAAPAVVIALALLVIGLGSKDLWYDEALSVAFARLPWSDLGHALSRVDGSFALYYTVLHFWLHLGQSAAVVRALSVVFAVATIPFMFLLAREMFDTRTAIAASLLLSIDRFFISFGQEARMYALLLLTATAGCLFFVRAARTGDRRDLGWYVASMTLTLYAHPFGLLTLVAQAVCLTLPTYRRHARAVGAAMIVVAVLAIPAALLVAHNGASQLFWLPRPTPATLALFFVALAGNKFVFLVDAALIVVAIVNVRRADPPRRDAFTALIVWALLPIVVIVVASFVKPLFYPRYLIATLTPLLVMVAVGFASLRARLPIAAASLVVVLGSVLALEKYYHDTYKNGWRATVGTIAADASPGKGIIIFPRTATFPFAFAQREDHIVTAGPIAFPADSADVWDDNHRPQPPPVARVRQIANQYPDLWAVAMNSSGGATVAEIVAVCRQDDEQIAQQRLPSITVVHCQARTRPVGSGGRKV